MLNALKPGNDAMLASIIRESFEIIPGDAPCMEEHLPIYISRNQSRIQVDYLESFRRYGRDGLLVFGIPGISFASCLIKRHQLLTRLGVSFPYILIFPFETFHVLLTSGFPNNREAINGS